MQIKCPQCKHMLDFEYDDRSRNATSSYCPHCGATNLSVSWSITTGGIHLTTYYDKMTFHDQDTALQVFRKQIADYLQREIEIEDNSDYIWQLEQMLKIVEAENDKS